MNKILRSAGIQRSQSPPVAVPFDTMLRISALCTESMLLSDGGRTWQSNDSTMTLKLLAISETGIRTYADLLFGLTATDTGELPTEIVVTFEPALRLSKRILDTCTDCWSSLIVCFLFIVLLSFMPPVFRIRARC